MDDREVLILEAYMKVHLFAPDIKWPKEEFEIQAYSRWAANEILEELMDETMKLPYHISGLEPRSAVDIVEEFIERMDYYSEENSDPRKQHMFALARDEGKSILDLFL